MSPDVAHLSGRFSRLAILLYWHIMRAVKRGVFAVCLTEVDRASRGKILHKVEGFKVLRAGNGWKGESAILVREKTHKVIDWGYYKVVDDVPGGRGPQVAVWAVVEDRETGERTFLTTTHHAARVEAYYRKDKWNSARRSHSNGIRNWASETRRLARKHNCPVIVGTADFNINLRNSALRKDMQKLLGNLQLPDPIPNAGTFGKRLIDAYVISGEKNSRMAIEKAHAASDHKSFVIQIWRFAAPADKEEQTVRGFCPFALNKNIAPGSNDPPIKPRVAILHVDAMETFSLEDYFRYRSGGIESHFHVRLDGVIEQYRNIYFQADANYKANDFAVSIETQGYGSGRWNDLQLASIKRLLIWLNEEAGIPLEKCETWDGSGVGYHIQFGSPGWWTNVAKSCPGAERIKQYNNDIVPWMATGGEEDDDMAFSKEAEQRLQRFKEDIEAEVKQTLTSKAFLDSVADAVAERMMSDDVRQYGLNAPLNANDPQPRETVRNYFLGRGPFTNK